MAWLTGTLPRPRTLRGLAVLRRAVRAVKQFERVPGGFTGAACIANADCFSEQAFRTGFRACVDRAMKAQHVFPAMLERPRFPDSLTHDAEVAGRLAPAGFTLQPGSILS